MIGSDLASTHLYVCLCLFFGCCRHLKKRAESNASGSSNAVSRTASINRAAASGVAGAAKSNAPAAADAMEFSLLELLWIVNQIRRSSALNPLREELKRLQSANAVLRASVDQARNLDASFKAGILAAKAKTDRCIEIVAEMKQQIQTLAHDRHNLTTKLDNWKRQHRILQTVEAVRKEIRIAGMCICVLESAYLLIDTDLTCDFLLFVWVKWNGMSAAQHFPF